MSREGRKIVDHLLSIASSKNIEYTPTPIDMMLADLLILEFYATIVNNTLKTRIKTIKTLTDKHIGVAYWYPVIKNMYKSNTSVPRNQYQLNSQRDHQLMAMIYSLISEFVITDYSIEDAYMVYTIITTCDYDIVQSAVRVSKQSRVYEIRYINAIIQKEIAKKNMKLESYKEMEEMKRDYENEFIHQRSVLDMAQIDYNWEKAKENAEIERRFAELMSRGGIKNE